MIVGWLSCIVGHTPIFAGYTDGSLLAIFIPLYHWVIGCYLYIMVGCRYTPRSLLAMVDQNWYCDRCLLFAYYHCLLMLLDHR